MTGSRAFALALPALLALASVGPARAQFLIEGREALADDRPEAWAMNHASAATLLTAFGEVPALAPGQWRLALEASLVPHLDAGQRTVGFNGHKEEDLNKSPVFGRLRASVGLPAGWVAELGYSPPVIVDGAHPEHLFAAAIGRRLLAEGTWSLSARAFGQNGSIQGDITCPARLAGVQDFVVNRYGCQAPSRDEVTLNHYGLDLVLAGGRGDWGWHVDAGLVRTETEVQVDALVYDSRDRTRLVARDVLPYLAAGGRRRLSAHWSVAAEMLYVPLKVRRGGSDQVEAPGGGAGGHDEGGAEDRPRVSDDYTGLRLSLVYDF